VCERSASFDANRRASLSLAADHEAEEDLKLLQAEAKRLTSLPKKDTP